MEKTDSRIAVIGIIIEDRESDGKTKEAVSKWTTLEQNRK